MAVLLATMLSGCAAPSGHAPVKPQSLGHQLLARAEQVIHERGFVDALALCEQGARVSPHSADFHGCRGKSLFRMARYREAEEAYREALTHDPTAFHALHRAWAAHLQHHASSSRARERVADEIEASQAAAGRDPAVLLAVARGYGYLHQRGKQLEALRQLVPLATSPETRESAAALLLELTIEEKTANRRAALAELYIQHFPRSGNVDLAFDLLFHTLLREAGSEQAATTRLREYLDRGIDTEPYRLAIARRLVHLQQWPDEAARLLTSLTRDHGHLSPPRDERTRLELAPRAEALYLLGLFQHRNGESGAAEISFHSALRLDPMHAKALLELGRLAIQRDELDQALDYLRHAVEMGALNSPAEEELRHLLKTRFGHTGDPRLYFASESTPARFTDITVEAGLKGIGSGRIAWGDYNDDGLPDLLLDGRLFRNTGSPSFLETTDTLGLPGSAGINGGLWADYDNDGDLDLYLTSHGRNRLLRNNTHRFEDVSDSAFADAPEEPTEAAAWGDIDNDGHLDLYVANYELAAVERGICSHDRLYRNRGDGRFEDISRAAGIRPDEPLCGRGATWADVNADGHLDIAVANYRLDPNLLWLNQGDGSFRDWARASGMRGHNNEGLFGHSIGIAVGDMDSDRLPDLYVSNLAHPRHLAYSDLSALLINASSAAPAFRDTYDRAGLRFEETSANPTLGDVDNDGDLDLYVTSIYPGRESHLYLNDGAGRFTNISWASGARVENGWGSAFADFDLDGDLDLLVASHDGVRLLRNNTAGNNWIAVRLVDPECNYRGIGSTLTLRHGPHIQQRTLAAGQGTGSQSPAVAHFGLGGHTGPVDIEVRNLCGQTVRRRASSLNRHMAVRPP